MNLEGYTVARSVDDAISRASTGDCHESLEDAQAEMECYAPDWAIYEVSIKATAVKV